MAWEKCGHGFNRYYRTELTVAGHRTRRYYGTGPDAQRQAARDATERQQRREQRDVAAARAEHLDRLAAPVDHCHALADAAFGRALRAAGYRQHHRGEWRRAKASTGETHMEPTDLTTWAHGAGPRENAAGMWAALEPVRSAAADGDRTVLPAVQKALDMAPRQARTWGDLSYQAELALVREASGGDILRRECQGRFVAGLRQDLSLDGDSPLERLLIDRVVLSYLHLHVIEASSTDGMGVGMVEAHQKRIDRAQRRYLAAVKSLAQIRRLLRPSVQVNIAEKQINVVS